MAPVLRGGVDGLGEGRSYYSGPVSGASVKCIFYRDCIAR
jgi:hypothetical protein